MWRGVARCTLAQCERVLLAPAHSIRNSPGGSQCWFDHTVRAVRDQSFVHPIVRKELVWTIRVRVQATHCREQTGLCARGHCDIFGATLDLEGVHRVVEPAQTKAHLTNTSTHATDGTKTDAGAGKTALQIDTVSKTHCCCPLMKSVNRLFSTAGFRLPEKGRSTAFLCTSPRISFHFFRRIASFDSWSTAYAPSTVGVF